MPLVNPEKLAGALAERLRAVIPAEVEVTATGERIRLSIRGTVGWSEADLRWPLEQWEGEEAVCSAVAHVLDGFQDDIAETVGEPWPALSPGPMPEPFAYVRDGELVAGYGDLGAPVLGLEPIGLRELA